jgi:hypothetical protein
MTTKQRSIAKWVSIIATTLFPLSVIAWKAGVENRFVHQDKYSLDSLRIENHLQDDHKLLERLDKRTSIALCGGLKEPQKSACEAP